MYPRHILVSGGWGYGNLGDDAILTSTLKLLKNRYPNSSITVMTYDVDDTLRVVSELPGVKVIPSIHRALVGTLSYRSFGVRSKPNQPISKIARWAYEAYAGLCTIASLRTSSRMFRRFAPEFERADLFVQAGGGYFNGGWRDSLFAHSLELAFAKKVKTRSLVTGQTIGPFKHKILQRLGLEALRLATYISVRDAVSQQDLLDSGIQCDLIPDIALSDIEYDSKRESVIAVVVNSHLDLRFEAVTNGLASAARELAYPIVVYVTRTWEADINAAQELVRSLRAKGADASFRLPSSWQEFQHGVASSPVLVSQNLHGLILGWRAGVPGICLTGEQKFVAFMHQSRQPHRLLPPEEVSEHRLHGMILKAVVDAQDSIDSRHELASTVVTGFHDALDRIFT